MRRTLLSLLGGLLAPALWVSVAWADAETGDAYFRSVEGGNCITCHSTGSKRLIGPGMENVTKRHSDVWLRLWLKNPQALWSSDHPETLELKSRVHKTRVKVTSCQKKPMTEEQIGDLLDFLKTLEKE
ncbi:MAG: c-type cytochrome [Dehalococcoidia bacterium]